MNKFPALEKSNSTQSQKISFQSSTSIKTFEQLIIYLKSREADILPFFAKNLVLAKKNIPQIAENIPNFDLKYSRRDSSET